MIRLMTIEDYDSVVQLWRSVSGVGLRSLDDSREGIARFLARNPKTSFVLEEDRKIIGVILAGHDGRRGYIYHTVVQAERQGEGLGKVLTDAACQALASEGINKASLLVFANNVSGNAFWEAQGWEKREDVIYRNKTLNPENR